VQKAAAKRKATAPAPLTRTAAKPVPVRAAAKPAPPSAKPERPPAPSAPAFYEPLDLPEQYHIDRIVLMPRDPNWLYAYWEITPEQYGRALGKLGISAEASRAILRVHDVTDLIDPASGRPRLADSRSYFTIDLVPMADRWYIRVEQPDRVYCVEYLVVAPDGRAVSVMSSNPAATPSDRVSDVVDEEWSTGGPQQRRAGRPPGLAESKWLTEQKRRAATSPGLGGWPSSSSARQNPTGKPDR